MSYGPDDGDSLARVVRVIAFAAPTRPRHHGRRMIGALPEQGSGPSTVPSLSPSDALVGGLHMQHDSIRAIRFRYSSSHHSCQTKFNRKVA